MLSERTKILVFSGSLRSGSYNTSLAAEMSRVLALRDVHVVHLSLSDYSLPLYDADLERNSGVPEAARKLHGHLCSCAGLFIASPEYNASVSPLIKNTLDWVSRVPDLARNSYETRATPFRGCVCAIGSVSQGASGGVYGLSALRTILEMGLGAIVLPEQISVPDGASVFDHSGYLQNQKVQEALERLAETLKRYTSIFSR